VSRPAVTTAVEAVAADLRAAILAGDRPPGSWLREEQLAAHYEVARHTLRAALRALAAQRLVVIEPHRGARVAALDADQLRGLFELRTALEVEAARLLAGRPRSRPGSGRSGPGQPGAEAGPGILPPWPAEIDAAADRLDRLCRQDPPDRAAVDDAHLALHHALVAAAGSPRITQAHAELATEQRLALLQSRPALPVHRMADLHRELLDRLRVEGPEALRNHLAAGREFVTDPAP
jgi:DNA-binding GntR family transcriptional regulator